MINTRSQLRQELEATNIQPAFDDFDSLPHDSGLLTMEEHEAANKFMNGTTPEGQLFAEKFANPKNAELLWGYLQREGVPVTVWNLTLAFRAMRNIMQPNPAPIPEIVVQEEAGDSMALRQLRREAEQRLEAEVKAARALDTVPTGRKDGRKAGVSDSLKQAYLTSLADARQTKTIEEGLTPKEIGAARIVIRTQFPEYRPESYDFNECVCVLVNKAREAVHEHLGMNLNDAGFIDEVCELIRMTYA